MKLFASKIANGMFRRVLKEKVPPAGKFLNLF
jgi:hypothetical protein